MILRVLSIHKQFTFPQFSLKNEYKIIKKSRKTQGKFQVITTKTFICKERKEERK
jgi:hypothetical protein